MQKNTAINILSKLILIIACSVTFFLLFPTVDANINDPNMIVYFNTDEGWLMDLAWSLYSGEKRESFQGDFDVGIGLIYLADFARGVLSRFIVITPGRLVLILRWLYLCACIGALIALWRMVAFHFGKGWQPALAVLLLASRPAIAYFSTNLKAEPLVLLIMIIGLDHALRVIDGRSGPRNLLIAIACASIAFLVKYAGIFLLLAVIGSMYFSNRNENKEGANKNIFPNFKFSWVFPAFAGFLIMALPVLTILFYVRKSTGFTWYEQFGLWGSLERNKAILFLLFTGFAGMLFSLLIRIFEKSRNAFLKRAIAWINEINSYSLLACGIFLGFSFLFGIRWIISPGYFLKTYAQLGPTFLGTGAMFMAAEKGFILSMFYNVIEKIKAFDPIIIILFIFYLGTEIFKGHRFPERDSTKRLKRYVLLVFLIPFAMLMLSMGRMAQHHMLPFFVVVSILSIQGFRVFMSSFKGKKMVKNTVIALIGALFIIDVSLNACETIKSRMFQFHQKEDIAYEIRAWWRENIPANARVLADHYIHVYIPPGYKNVKTLPWNETNRVRRMRELIDDYRPRFIYYRVCPNDVEPVPGIEELIPDKRTRPVKVFNCALRKYQKNAGCEFFIYEILY